MAEPTRFTTLEADAGGLPVFTTPTSIFDVPNTLLGGFPIGADAGAGFLQGAGATFGAPSAGGYTFSFGAPGSMAPGGMSLADQLNPWNVRTDITQLAPGWGTWNPSTDVTTAGDTTNVRLQGTPYKNIGISGAVAPSDVMGSVTTGASGDAIMMDPYKVGAGGEPPLTMNASDYIQQPVTGGAGLLGNVSEGALGGVVSMDPFQVVGTRPASGYTLNVVPAGSSQAGGGTTAGGSTEGAVQMDPFQVRGNREPSGFTLNIEQPGVTPTLKTDVGVPSLPPVVVGETKLPKTAGPSTTDMMGILNKWTENVGKGVVVPPKVEVPDTTVKKDDGVKTDLPPGGSTPSGTTQTGTTATSTTTTSSAMNQRDLAAELQKTMAAFNQYRPEIQKMYGELYQQFMPKGISQTEQGLIDQYKTDLTRLQQRQAGMLSPEDVRQA